MPTKRERMNTNIHNESKFLTEIFRKDSCMPKEFNDRFKEHAAATMDGANRIGKHAEKCSLNKVIKISVETGKALGQMNEMIYTMINKCDYDSEYKWDLLNKVTKMGDEVHDYIPDIIYDNCEVRRQ